MTTSQCNILIIGKSGAGKSALTNYLLGKKVAEVGAGKPTTPEEVQKFSNIIKNVCLNVYDSWGIEANKYEQWNTLIENELSQHFYGKKLSEWFHAIVYCIQVTGHRAEVMDIKIIHKFLFEGYNVVIALTKADSCKDGLNELRSSIIKDLETVYDFHNHDKQLKIIPICSEEKMTRSGLIKPFGRGKVISAIIDLWDETLKMRLAGHVMFRIKNKIDCWVNDEICKISKKITGSSEDNKNLIVQINNDSEKFWDKLIKNDILSIYRETFSCVVDSKKTLSSVNENNLIKKIFEPRKFGKWQRIISDINKFSRNMVIFKRHDPYYIEIEKNSVDNYIKSIGDKLKKESESYEDQIKNFVTYILQRLS